MTPPYQLSMDVGGKMPLHVQGLGIEEIRPRREPLWLNELDLLLHVSLEYQQQRPEGSTIDGLSCLSRTYFSLVSYIANSHLDY